MGLILDGETLPGAGPPVVSVLLAFVPDVWYVFKLGEHKGVPFRDDPDD